jgi:RNA recognition motif-containing protein
MLSKLFVGGLPFVFSNEELKALFTEIGAVVSAEMVYDPDRGRTRGFGFVEMGTPELAQAAIGALSGRLIGTRKIFVVQARERTGPAKPPPQGSSKPFPRKAGRDRRPAPGPRPEAPRSVPPGPSSFDQPSWPSGRKYSAGSNPTRPFSFRDERGTPGERPSRFKGPRGRGPSSGPRSSSGPPSSFGAPKRSGFSRPNKWEPRGDDKRSFGAPRKERGDFGPSRPTGRPPKKQFWSKFEKKKPRE